MKVTNQEIYEAWEPLKKLAEKPFPIKISYSLAKLANKIRGQYEVIEEVRSGLVKKHGKVNEVGELTVDRKDTENWDKFMDEYDVLMKDESTLPFDKVIISIREGENPIQVEPEILMALEKFVEVE